jgi:signal peptidase II
MRGEARVGLGRWLLFWSIALGGTLFDLVTKSIVFSWIGPPPAAPVPIVPHILEWHTSQNTGALWGIGATIPGSSLIFAGLSVVAAIVICYYLFMLGAASSRVLTVALGLIMAGAMGNCYDRLRFGHVRDFVHFHVDAIGFDCAIFNFADNMLVIGAITLVLYALRPEKSPADEREALTSLWKGYFAGKNPEPGNSPSGEGAGEVDARSVEMTMLHQAATSCPVPRSQPIHPL